MLGGRSGPGDQGLRRSWTPGGSAVAAPDVSRGRFSFSPRSDRGASVTPAQRQLARRRRGLDVRCFVVPTNEISAVATLIAANLLKPHEANDFRKVGQALAVAF